MDNFNNNYNTSHQFDAMNIANERYEYIGTGILGPSKSSKRGYDDYDECPQLDLSKMSHRIFLVGFCLFHLYVYLFI